MFKRKTSNSRSSSGVSLKFLEFEEEMNKAEEAYKRVVGSNFEVFFVDFFIKKIKSLRALYEAGAMTYMNSEMRSIHEVFGEDYHWLVGRCASLKKEKVLKTQMPPLLLLSTTVVNRRFSTPPVQSALQPSEGSFTLPGWNEDGRILCPIRPIF